MELNQIISFLKTILPSLVIATFTSILTVRLAIRRYHEEKWWDKKQEMYSNVFTTLHGMKNYFAEHYEDQIDPDHLTEEKRKKLSKDWGKFSRDFKKHRDLASFHLSKKAVEILDMYIKEKQEARTSEHIYDWIEGDLVAATKCLESLIIEAKKDLKVK